MAGHAASLPEPAASLGTLTALPLLTCPHAPLSPQMVFCFSPVGATLRVRARRFPAIVTCSAIDWFHAWPQEALVSVSRSFMEEVEGLAVGVVSSLSAPEWQPLPVSPPLCQTCACLLLLMRLAPLVTFLLSVTQAATTNSPHLRGRREATRFPDHRDCWCLQRARPSPEQKGARAWNRPELAEGTLEPSVLGTREVI